MITEQSVIRDLPGAYDVAVCGVDRVPLSNFGALAPRTMFDEAIRTAVEIHTEGIAVGVVGRNGEYAALMSSPFGRKVTPGDIVAITAGTDWGRA